MDRNFLTTSVSLGALGLAASLLVACGSSSSLGETAAQSLATDDGGSLVASGDGGSAVGASDAGTLACAGSVTLTQVNQDVFSSSCASCHSGGSPAAGLDLSAGNAFGNLVNVSAAEAPNLMLVVPGDPTDSFLVQKMTGNFGPNEGGLMPPGNTPLDPSLINEVSCWIQQGALND